MFMGHYAAAIMAKAVKPKLSLWIYVGAAQLLDIIWAVLVLCRVERLSFNHDLPGSVLVLEYMPWSHSLEFALVWSAIVVVIARWSGSVPSQSIVLGLVVISHWLFDLMVHRPDLALWRDGPIVGLGLWDIPIIEQIIEIGLLGLASVVWAGVLEKSSNYIWPVVTFLTYCLGIQMLAQMLPAPTNATALLINALLVFAISTVVAALIDPYIRPQRQTILTRF